MQQNSKFPSGAPHAARCTAQCWVRACPKTTTAVARRKAAKAGRATPALAEAIAILAPCLVGLGPFLRSRLRLGPQTAPARADRSGIPNCPNAACRFRHVAAAGRAIRRVENGMWTQTRSAANRKVVHERIGLRLRRSRERYPRWPDSQLVDLQRHSERSRGSSFIIGMVWT